eukprot:1256433-Amphidinium_carterae.1
MQVWRRGRLPPVEITTRALGVDTQWSAWGNPVHQNRISSFRVSMFRTRALVLACLVRKLVECLTNACRFCVLLLVAPYGKIADSRPEFQGLDSGLATPSRQLKLDGQSQTDNVKTALNAALGGVWHEARANAVFDVGAMCSLWRSCGGPRAH